ncbi:MAG: D-alanyl-D-alanine carboxypeptidase/D-alanyl-D-alanine-endopeptidase [Chitinophagaceae bacterium]|nr:D-alanyl-D-alanine carboxypeptidase/D-alanyl-D-alanine-endopeptidase [Chitinophagaceae bacterium]
MKKIVFVFCAILFASVSFSQSVSQNLQKAWQQFESDSQLKHAISSLYVIDAKTGQVVFDKNSQIGLAPASTQKIITAATAFELLGKEFRYKTELGYDGKIINDTLKGNIFVLGTMDPTLGSWRWKNTSDSNILGIWMNEIKKLKISEIEGDLLTNTAGFTYQSVPDGWIWQDIGNYYGAGCYSLNWKENQFELNLTSENKIGGTVDVNKNGWISGIYINELKAASKSSGDNAYVYYDNLISGTIPLGERNFKISAASQDPISDLLNDFGILLERNSIGNSRLTDPSSGRMRFNNDSADLKKINKFYTHYSPSLDSISYWFLKKSINLYGEALLKTFAYEKNGFGSTDDGVKIVTDFWKQKGIDEDELNISDGSGLSPQNRTTTHAQVEILKYAKGKDWYPYYLNGFPDYNGMKMKSGTIRDVKGFAGYHKAKDGKEYIFSFLVNNYNGRTSSVVSKMYKVLDELK